MRQNLSNALKLSLIIIFYFTLSHINAKTYTAKPDGKWESADTWNETGFPTLATDTVLIDGFTITLDANTTSLTGVDGIITIVYLKLTSYSSLTVEENCRLIRTEENNQLTFLKMSLYDESTFLVNGDFEYDYKNSGFLGIYEEMYLTDKSVFSVGGETKLTARKGNAFDFYMEGESQANLNDFSINFNGGSNIEIFDQQRQLLYRKMIMISNGKAQLSTSEGNILSSGIYFLMITY